MAKGDDGSTMTFGFSLAATTLQVGGGLTFLYGVTPLSGELGSAFMGIGGLGLAAGVGLGLANSK